MHLRQLEPRNPSNAGQVVLVGAAGGLPEKAFALVDEAETGEDLPEVLEYVRLVAMFAETPDEIEPGFELNAGFVEPSRLAEQASELIARADLEDRHMDLVCDRHGLPGVRRGMGAIGIEAFTRPRQVDEDLGLAAAVAGAPCHGQRFADVGSGGAGFVQLGLDETAARQVLQPHCIA